MSTNYPGTRIVDLASHHEVIDAVLSDLIGSAGPIPKVMYRGVGDARYELIPSALRTDPHSINRFFQLSGQHGSTVDADQIDTMNSMGQAFAEFSVLKLFYRSADRQGLSMPHIDSRLHESLLEDFNDLPFGRSRLDELSNGWPEYTLRPILALAQHYGLPTRMLDWSNDPFIACYFAAERGSFHLENATSVAASNNFPSHIGIWRTRPNLLTKISLGSQELNRLNVVNAPLAANDYLAAQKGLFTVYANAKGMNLEAVDRRPLNEVVDELLHIPNPRFPLIIESVQKELGDSLPFTLYRLPIEQSPSLLFTLDRMGYDAARLFPGFAGAVLSVSNKGRFAAHGL